MTDFSKMNIHCSSIGNIMGYINGQNNRDRYNKAIEKFNEWGDKYMALDERRRAMKMGINILEKRTVWEKKAEEYLKIIDVDELSKGAKSHLKKVYAYFKYGKWSATKDKGTKYTDKGIMAENDSIALISLLEGRNYNKNEQRINNNWLTGIPDLFLGEDIYKAEYIIDVKTPYDIETYLDVLGKPLDNGYWWQIQGYLAITGSKLGEVSYCLVDTPPSIINKERYRLMERLDVVTEEDPIYVEKEKELVNNLTFGDIPTKDRRIRFYVERDEDAINRIYKKVEDCRRYMAEIEALHMQGEFLAKEPTVYDESEEKEEESDDNSD